MASLPRVRAAVLAVLVPLVLTLGSPVSPAVADSSVVDTSKKSIMVMAPTGVAGNGDRVSIATSFWADVLPHACLQRDYRYKDGSQRVPGSLCRFIADWRYQAPGQPWSAWGNRWDADGNWITDFPDTDPVYFDHEMGIQLAFPKEGGPVAEGTKFQVRVRGWRVTDKWKITWVGRGISPASVWDGTRLKPAQEMSEGAITKIMTPLQIGANTSSSSLTVHLDFYSDVLPASCLFNFPTPADPRPQDWTGWGERCSYVVFWRFKNAGKPWSNWDITLGGDFDVPIDQLNPYGGTGSGMTVAGMSGTDVRRGSQVQAQVRTLLADDNSFRWGPSWTSRVLKTK